MPQRNEAAERLRETLIEDGWGEQGTLAMNQLDAARAEERRNVVAQIRDRFYDPQHRCDHQILLTPHIEVEAALGILDEVAGESR